MKSQKLIYCIMLIMMPGLSWGVIDAIPVPEPGILPMLALGAIVGVTIKYVQRKK